jgi:toxin-antitoxin system, toxin component, bro family|nr:MAG TPA: KilAC domain protein [Caudoviricetes sp.]
MNELLKIDTSNAEHITVSARDLYEFLEATERFNSWFDRMTQYGLVENTDYTTVKKLTEVPNNGGVQIRELDDYQLTIDTAKQIAMLQRNEKGTQARKYFIQVENAWNSPERVMARALEIAHKTIATLELENNKMKPKALFADAVASSKTSILIGQLAKILTQNGYQIGQNRLFEKLRNEGFLSSRKGADWNMPQQRFVEQGLFEIKESTHIDGNGVNVTTKTVKVTGKGQQYFINKFLGS